MIRTLRDEVERYGPYLLAAESQYDHPMLWGAKRTGPDIARLGGKFSDDWNVAHLIYPRAVEPPSIMPAYPWLATTTLVVADPGDHLAALRALGVPYTDDMIANAPRDAAAQANPDGDTAGITERDAAATTLRRFSGTGTADRNGCGRGLPASAGPVDPSPLRP